MDKQPSDKIDSSWNTSGGVMGELIRLRELANIYFEKRDLGKALVVLHSMRQTVAQVFSIEEKKDLTKIERKFLINELQIKNSNVGFVGTPATLLFDRAILYDEYNDKLMENLQNHGLSLATKEDISAYNG